MLETLLFTTVALIGAVIYLSLRLDKLSKRVVAVEKKTKDLLPE